MSYILDALKKSDQERKKGKVPGLDTVQDFSTQKNKVARPPWLLIAVAALAFNGLLFAIWIYSERDDNIQTPVITATEGEAEKVLSPAEATGTSSSEVAQETSLPIETATEEPTEQRLIETAVEDQISQTQPPTESETSSPDAATEEVVAESVIEQPENQVVELSSATENVDLEGVDDTEQVSSEPLAFKDIPYDIKSDLPEIRISLHYYSSDYTSRKVSINGRMRREGSEVGEGLIVEEITKEGVVFSFRETLFYYEVFSR